VSLYQYRVCMYVCVWAWVMDVTSYVQLVNNVRYITTIESDFCVYVVISASWGIGTSQYILQSIDIMISGIYIYIYNLCCSSI